jgi:aspartate/glutamate racemase
MEQAFYRERLEARGIEVLVPDAAQREVIHAVIYQELYRATITLADVPEMNPSFSLHHGRILEATPE